MPRRVKIHVNELSCIGNQDYVIKVYVGGINVVSGEPARGDTATKLRRQT
jgi:hypothetical protein